MRSLIVTLFSLIFMACNTSKNNSSLASEDVTVTVNYTSDYCGGAYPSDEILESLKTLRPLSNEVIYIKKKTEGSELKSLETNQEGQFTATLSQGSYEIYLREKIAAEECSEWQSTANGTFEVPKNTENLAVQVHRTCNPCDEPSR